MDTEDIGDGLGVRDNQEINGEKHEGVDGSAGMASVRITKGIFQDKSLPGCCS